MSAAQQVVAEQDEETVATAAGRAMAEANGDIAAAAKRLQDWVRKNHTLKRALLDPLIEYACYNAVRRQLGEGRRKVWNAPKPVEGMSQADKVAILARSNLMLFALPIANGKLLKDATREEVGQASEFYGKQATDMAHKSRWLALIGQIIPEGKIVGQVLSEGRLSELQDEAADA